MGPWTLWVGAAWAGELPHAELHGDVKSFFVAGAPRPWLGFSDEALQTLGMSEDEALDAFGLAADPYAQGVLGGRLKGTATMGVARLDVHWAFAAQTAGQDTSVGGLSTGVGLSAPELLPLTWSPDTGDALSIQHRLDRLALSAKLPHVDLALGRQPISFGAGRIFTPLDLVNPFHPATLDTEYKPGVDALRADVYAGVSGRVTAVAAWAGQPVVGEEAVDPSGALAERLVLAAAGQTTVGVTDLLGFAGAVRGEPVFGLGAVSALGPVGVHGEASLTLPQDGEDPFVRAVLGADGRPTAKTTLMAEAYLQTFGATDPADYLDALDSARFARGEVWQLGQIYAAVAVSQELTPLVYANLSVISNLRDPSALLALGGSWSVADNAEVGFGAYLGLGAAPDPVDLDLAVDPTTGALGVVAPDTATLAGSVNSEFGLYPGAAYVQVRTYF